jgi:hypothetical protein
MALLSFLDREKSVAHPGDSRWLVPPAALAIHLAIGQVNLFSVLESRSANSGSRSRRLP